MPEQSSDQFLQRLNPWKLAGAVVAILAVCYLIFSAYVFFDGNSDSYKTYRLQAPTEQKVIVVTTDEAVIKFGYRSFKQQLDVVFKEHDKPMYSDAEFSALLIKSPVLTPNSYAAEYTYTGRTDFGLIVGVDATYDGLLRKGQAQVYDKTTKTFVDKIIWHHWRENCGPLCGGSGSAWELPSGTIFFEGSRVMS